jgi:hypothetical protein
MARTVRLGTVGLGAPGIAAPPTAWTVFWTQLAAVGLALSPGGSRLAFDAQLTCLGERTAQASGFLAEQWPGKAVS